jgi:class 3 adenylate cyclase
MSTRNLTIMFTDIKGFTERTARSNRDYVVKMLEQQDKLLKPVIAKYSGNIIKSIGDAYLVTFESPTNAVICGLMMQHALRRYNRSAPADDRIEVRVAINTGEVNLVGTDVLGDPVNVASRVEGITEANEVWFTEATYLSMNKQEVPTSVVGEFKLKGVPEAVRIYRASVEETQILYRRHFDDHGHSREDHGAHAAAPAGKSRVWITMLILLVIGVALWLFAPASGPEIQARRLIVGQKFPQALQVLERALVTKSTDPELQDLTRQAVEGEITGMISRGEVVDARGRLELYRGRHTFLGAMSPLMRDIRIAEVAQKTKIGRDQPGDIEKLIQDYPDDAAVWFWTATHLITQGESGLRAAMPKFKKAIELDPKNFSRKPETIAAFEKAIGVLSHYEMFERATYGKIIVKDYFDDLRPKIVQGLTDEKNPERRFNAFQLIKEKDELAKTDVLPFFLINLNDPNLTSVQQAQTMNFFEALLPKAADPELRKKLPAKLPLFPALLSNDEKISAQALAVARGLFKESLADALAAALKGDDERAKAAAEKVLH